MILSHTVIQFLRGLRTRLVSVAPGWSPPQLAWECPASADVMLMTSKDLGTETGAGAGSVMGTTGSSARSPKQEEKWQKRESALLDITQAIIDEVGYAHFNMDALVRASDVSKGTVYNHFTSKEDCLAALCCRGMEELKDMFLRAQAFDGTNREKALAIHYAYRLHLKLHPALSMALVTARTAAFAEKTSPQRAARMRDNDATLFGIAFQVIEAAVAAGDLEITSDLNATVITFLTWSTSYGINMLEDTGFEHTISELLDQQNIALIGANVLMDGIGMKPLSKDWDYGASWQRIAEEVFPEENKKVLL